MRRQQRKVHSRYLILCTGQTEQFYAKEIKESLPRDAQRGIEIQIIYDPSKTNAKSLLEFAQRKQREARDQELAFKRIWILCDHDNDVHIGRLFQEAGSWDIYVAYTRPCIEFWFLLHFQMSGRPFASCKEVNELLKNMLPIYQKTRQRHFDMLRPHLDVAYTHAARLRESADVQLPEWERNPWTSMDHFVQWFLSLESKK